LTAGGIEGEVKGGRLRILKEGKVIKGVRELQHRTFDAGFALEKGQEVTYVSERAVFELTREGLILTEIAAGFEVKDIQAVVGFPLKVSPALKQMDERLFRPEPLGAKGFKAWA
jgi:propionate CoA-transferase